MNKLRFAMLALCSSVWVGCGDITGSTGRRGESAILCIPTMKLTNGTLQPSR